MTTSRRSPAALEAVDRITSLDRLDQPAKVIGKAVRDAVPAGPVKDALSGTWLGHALHPLLTDLPIGTWTSAVLLDWLGGERSEAAADRLIALGIAFTAPAVATGWTEWADSEVADDGVRRIGIVHAAANVGATALFGASLAARRGGSRGAGRLLALAGAGVLGVSGYLGGHLAFAEGLGVDQTAFEAAPDDWMPALRESELPEGESRYAEVAGVGVMVARSGRRDPRDLQQLLAPRWPARRGRARRRLRHLPLARLRVPAGRRRRRARPGRLPAAGLAGARARRADRAQRAR